MTAIELDAPRDYSQKVPPQELLRTQPHRTSGADDDED